MSLGLPVIPLLCPLFILLIQPIAKLCNRPVTPFSERLFTNKKQVENQKTEGDSKCQYETLKGSAKSPGRNYQGKTTNPLQKVPAHPPSRGQHIRHPQLRQNQGTANTPGTESALAPVTAAKGTGT